MKRFSLWIGLLPVFLAASVATPVRSQMFAQASESIQISGQSGGSVASSCGNIAEGPNQVFQISEPAAAVDIHVESAGAYTLMIESSNGYSECVIAVGGEAIDSPGILNQGTYNVYIGDRSGASHPFTLRIEK